MAASGVDDENNRGRNEGVDKTFWQPNEDKCASTCPCPKTHLVVSCLNTPIRISSCSCLLSKQGYLYPRHSLQVQVNQQALP